MLKKILLLTLLFLFVSVNLTAQSYDFGKTKVISGFDPAVALSEETKSYLDALITFLYANDTFTVKITGHSDNSGTFEQNEKLALERVKMVSDYIISKGIQKDRIIDKGEGARMPIAPNDSPEKRNLNNRVEISVIFNSTEKQ
jgi:outer membrane protein OmpA-like peptidoglycan-associated protein